jgi:hypothetical protein
MNFWTEWALAVHRAVWFPLNWTLGLERPGINAPDDFAELAVADAIKKPAFRVIRGRGRAVPRRSRAAHS